MQTKTAEIADRIFRFSTAVDGIGPQPFTFNQFLVDADEPLLFHLGGRGFFPLVSEAVARVVPLERIRYLSFGHVESDECGSLNQWLAAAPKAEVLHSQIACQVSLNDLSDRPPRALADGETVDLGGRRVRWLYTPHVPHGWEAGAMFEESTATLLCGDILTHGGDGPAVTDADVAGPACAMEDMFHAMTMSPNTVAVLERMADLAPRTLAIMHGSSHAGAAAAQLRALAAYCAR